MDKRTQLVQGLFHRNAHVGMWNLDSSDVQSLYDIYTTAIMRGFRIDVHVC